MAIIVPIQDLDSPSGGTTQKVVEGHAVTFEHGQTMLEPTYVEKADATLNGNSTTITTSCGDSETRRNGSTNWNLAVDGIITQDQLSTLQSIATADEPVTVDAEVLGSRSGRYVVEDCSITHTDDLNTIDVPSKDGPISKPAYRFQLTLKAPT